MITKSKFFQIRFFLLSLFFVKGLRINNPLWVNHLQWTSESKIIGAVSVLMDCVFLVAERAEDLKRLYNTKTHLNNHIFESSA